MAVDVEKNQEVSEIELNDKNDENGDDGYQVYNNNEPFNYANEEYVCKEIDICLPVTIKPYAVGGVPIITPIGKAQETYGHKPCEYGLDVCNFTVCQKLCIKVPVKYTITTSYGEVCAREELMLDDSCK